MRGSKHQKGCQLEDGPRLAPWIYLNPGLGHAPVGGVVQEDKAMEKDLAADKVQLLNRMQ